MSTKIYTLFGEEIVPEPQKPVAKVRVKKGDVAEQAEAAPEKKKKEKKEEVVEQPAPTAPKHDVIAEQIAAAAYEASFILEAEKLAAAPVADEAHEEKKAPRKPKKEITEDADEPREPADIIPEDWHGDKKYYTIGEVSEFFKVKTSHIRFWTNEFKLKVRTTRKGDRLYTPEHVKELRAIYHLVKERGFTLSGAKTKLKAQNKRDVTTVDLKTSLQQFRSKLLILREQLV